jgi:hypothetical protein
MPYTCPEKRKEVKRKWAEANKDKINANLRRYRQEVRDWISAYKEANPCKDCGNHFNSWQMQFDHLKEKKLNVSLAASIEQARVEMEKCELVCANCHATRTYKRSHDR